MASSKLRKLGSGAGKDFDEIMENLTNSHNIPFKSQGQAIVENYKKDPEIVKDIMGDLQFENIVTKNIVSQPWLLNFELGSTFIPKDDTEAQVSADSEFPGTVYTQVYQQDDVWTVVPTIMENNQGILEYYPDPDEAFNRGYGIDFATEDRANHFSEKLHLWHANALETKTSTNPGEK